MTNTLNILVHDDRSRRGSRHWLIFQGLLQATTSATTQGLAAVTIVLLMAIDCMF